MNFLLQRMTQPELEPITLVEAKRHIRQFANITSEDDDITAWIKMARSWVEHYTGRVMIDQTWRLTVRQGPVNLAGDAVGGYTGVSNVYQGQLVLNAEGIYLRRSPVLAITSFTTLDAQQAETEVDPTTYATIDEGTRWPRIVPLSGAAWTGGSFRITFRAGFADRTGSPVTGAEVIPDSLKHAVKLIVANFDQNRGLVNIGNIVNKLPLGIDWLLAEEKCNLGVV